MGLRFRESVPQSTQLLLKTTELLNGLVARYTESKRRGVPERMKYLHPMNDIGFGIIGCGGIARKFAQDIRRVPGTFLQAVASRSQEKAVQFKNEHGAVQAYEGYEHILTDNEVKVVYIATPHHLHYNNARAALMAGKAVLCEKPMCLNLQQTQELIDLAREKRIFLMEALWTRFIPATTALLDFVQDGSIGSIQAIQASFGFNAWEHAPPRLQQLELGGGALMDIGIYPLYLCDLLLGKPESIHAIAVLEKGVDKQNAMVLKYKNGLATLQNSFSTHLGIQASIYGSKGRITMGEPFHASNKLIITKEGHTQENHYRIDGHGYTHQIAHVHDCIQQGLMESPLHRLEDSLRLAATLEETAGLLGVHYAV